MEAESEESDAMCKWCDIEMNGTSPEPRPLIEISGLSKQFGSVQALMDLDLQVTPGEIYGLLGPNGAGKTTTIRIITGLAEPTSGWVKIVGFDPANHPIEVKSRIGYVAETPILYESLSPRDFLEFVVSMRKIDQAAANRRVTQLASALDMAQ
jgi:ABC-2 type transport system ATP-binding protein